MCIKLTSYNPLTTCLLPWGDVLIHHQLWVINPFLNATFILPTKKYED